MAEPILNNRELASLVLLAAMVVFALVSLGPAAVVRAVGSVVSAAAEPKLLIPTVLYLVTILAALIPASRAGLWEPGLWNATVAWLIFSGLGLLFRTDEAMRRPGFFGEALRRTLGATALVEFTVNLEPFALWVEIPVQIVASFAVLIRSSQGHPMVRPLSDAYLGLLGLCAITWTIWQFAAEWSQVDHGMLAKEFLVPIWLTPVALILVFAYAVWGTYELAFGRMRFAAQGKPLWAQRLALVLRSGIWLPHLRVVSGQEAFRIARTDGFRDAWGEIGQIRREARERAAAEATSARRLVENAGRVGLDDLGRQLDQREHAATQAALRVLAAAQMRRYHSEGKYDDKLLRAMEPTLTRDALPHPSDIRIVVAADGQRWYAARRTITGHWFAIGAAEPPPDQWLFDGTDGPSGFPDEAEWDHWGGGKHSPDWG